jgi:hypothetical protein
MISRIEGDIEREVQSRFTAWAAVSAVARLPDPGEIVKGPFFQVDSADSVRSGLCEVQKPFRSVERDMVRERDPGFDRKLAIAGAAGFPVSRKRLDIADR